MRTVLPILAILSILSMTLLPGCQKVEERFAEPSPGPLALATREGSGRSGSEALDPSQSRETSRSDPWRDDGAAGERGGNGGGSPGASPSEDSPGEPGLARRSRGPRRIAADDLLASLDARSLPDGIYEVERPSRGWTGMGSSDEAFEELLERVEARHDWIQVIRLGPWRIRVIRDTFFDPYRRDSGWIDIDELDGPHGRWVLR